jgi:hypothetical protein
VELLREHGVALALQDHSWMPHPNEYKFDPITADFTYLRWLGDRQAIERVTRMRGKAVVNRANWMFGNGGA